MSEYTAPKSPEQQQPKVSERIRRFLGSRADSLQTIVAASEQREYDAHAVESYESVYASAKGINRQAAEAIKDMLGLNPNRTLAPKEIKSSEGKTATWSTLIAFNEQRQGSPYTQIEAATQPRMSFGGKEVLVDQLALEVHRPISKLGKAGDPYTEIFINGAALSEAAPDSTKWSIRIGADGEVVSAATNQKSKSPNALSPVDPQEVQGLSDMMTQLHFAIWEARTAQEVPEQS